MTVATASYVTGSIYTSANPALSASYAFTSSYALSASWAPGGGGSVAIQDEGSAQGSASTLNFTGTAVTATVAGGVATINVTGGSGGGLTTKSNVVANTSFTGSPRKATVTFTTAFPDTNYSITVTGENSRTWTIESKTTTGFVINSNSTTALTGNTYWQAIAYGEA